MDVVKSIPEVYTPTYVSKQAVNISTAFFKL